jgi:hypothetical protein
VKGGRGKPSYRPKTWDQVHADVRADVRANVRANVPQCTEHMRPMVERLGQFGPFWSCPVRVCDKTVPVRIHATPATGRVRFWSGRPP